ncbi:hypothetical protein CALCODRAFT_64361 [Calocera cornea HHB12733]|uniref:Uncharacterized protein n=1 Tax=Calocera cornea HHB12733 TaxID=1353952 RepID=A0A165DKN7_9BASI|nr:hypothetical protein CALCODRAFT_64361 [Calocera cornea HHB12733]
MRGRFEGRSIGGTLYMPAYDALYSSRSMCTHEMRPAGAWCARRSRGGCTDPRHHGVVILAQTSSNRAHHEPPSPTVRLLAGGARSRCERKKPPTRLTSSRASRRSATRKLTAPALPFHCASPRGVRRFEEYVLTLIGREHGPSFPRSRSGSSPARLHAQRDTVDVLSSDAYLRLR